MTRRAAALALALCAVAGATWAGEPALVLSISGQPSAKVCRLPADDPSKPCIDEAAPPGEMKYECVADGVWWPARRDSTGVHCISAGRPSWHERLVAWMRRVAGMKEGGR